MAATAWLYEYQVIRTEPNGNPVAQCRIHLTDPARAAVDQLPRIIALVITLDSASPNQYTQQVRNAVIAAGAAEVPPFTLNPADVIISAFG